MRHSREPAAIEEYLHTHIPLSAAMEVRVRSCEHDGVVLAAPLTPNLNHRATVFGGSATAVAILSAWSWLHWSLSEADFNCRVVIQRNQMEYLLPIERDFTAHCSGLSRDDWEKMQRTLKRYGKARCTLKAELQCDAQRVAEFTGEYVAMLGPESNT